MIGRLIIQALLLLIPATLLAQPSQIRFHRLTYNDGLSDNKVNCIIKSRDGFLWIGTPLGLNRYDGFRVRSFFNRPDVPSSLPDNSILDIEEDGEGMLWLDTSSGICIFNPVNGVADRNPSGWLSAHGMSGSPQRIASDSKRNLWIVSTSGRLYYYDFSKNSVTAATLPKGFAVAHVSDLTTQGNRAVITMDNGAIALFTNNGKEIALPKSVASFIPLHTGYQKSVYRAYADSRGGLWVWSQVGAFLYNLQSKSWKRLEGYVMSDVAEDHDHHFLIATDHGGLIIADGDGNIKYRLVNNPADPFSLPDNTLQKVYVDNCGVVWIGMYRMGLANYYRIQNQFDLLPWGDVCTMTQSTDGSLWLGTNDSGIRHYDFLTKRLTTIGKATSGLGTDVVVSSLAARDGSMWFGTFQGGMVRIKGGEYKVYNKGNSELRNNSVWSLAEIPGGLIGIGTLGGGVQVLNPKTGKFTTFDTHNSSLPSDFISSITMLKDGRLVVGHSSGFSIINLRNRQMVNIGQDKCKRCEKLTSLQTNQILSDNRGLLWIATASGINVYDVVADRLYTVDLHGVRQHTEIDAVAQDRNGIVWITSGSEIRSIRARKDADGWKFFTNTYGRSDGVQTRLFNKRSILCLRDGRMLFGGIDGVNIINPRSVRHQTVAGKVIFSGMTLFDRPVAVGDTINGHAILTDELNAVRELSLRHDENTFTILLASNNPGLPESPRFLYRLRGKDDRWLITTAHEPQVQFTNMPSGNYTLEVRPVDGDGNALGDIAVLKITVRPPFYLSVWAWIIYLLLAAFTIWYIWWRNRKNRRDEMERLELKKQKELEEMKLVFFTNLGHELRTPLTLIISPLESLIAHVSDHDVQNRLRLMQRNAHRLLDLVNQMLDVRRLMRGKETLRLSQGDVVELVRDICKQFSQLSDKGITLVFHTEKDSMPMSFDKDKLIKMVANLLSNAYKFSPINGRVEVSLTLRDGKWLDISVADNGPGVKDEDKRHLFERFYQSADNKKAGGSGIGLNLVWEYARMMGGCVKVGDHDGGGAIFTISIPVPSTPVLAIAKAKKSDNKDEEEGYVTAFASREQSQKAPVPAKRTETVKNEPVVKEGRTSTVLIVDDNEDFIQFLTAELSPYYNIHTAANGEQALDSIRKSRPDLVLTDVMMPVMDGNELCRQIKVDKDTRLLPVVMLTARLSDENEMESRECGADDYVKKPFSLPLLKMHIDSLLNKERISGDGKVQPRIVQPKITSEDEKFVDKATRYVEQHLDDNELSVEQMAQDIGMSRVQLYRRLVTVTGKTPSEFIRLIRLRHAERLLMESQMTISEISYKVGFSSQRYFSKCFKELYGYLPTEYKRRTSK